ncbi:hypothetical protein L6452_40274 [Arctium lappa]|uniref:Uncharacterized protein n=1 Tax=Arctium lappa TaxID=4217 RepID=A0ACB8XKY1_ARCLA|nr:hypothetical protein L6452_40274 [Arctium lappa]
MIGAVVASHVPPEMSGQVVVVDVIGLVKGTMVILVGDDGYSCRRRWLIRGTTNNLVVTPRCKLVPLRTSSMMILMRRQLMR